MKSYIKFLFLIGFISVNAQNSISGIITNTSKTPLFGVEIYSTQLHKGTTSDTEGKFLLKNIPNGKINLKISYLGYKTTLKEIVISNNDEVLKIILKSCSSSYKSF